MAYPTIDVMVNGVTVKAIDVSGDGTEVIIESSLDAEGKADMDKVADTSGATFDAKMEATTLENGLTAKATYAPLVRNLVAYNSAVTRAKLTTDTAQADMLADHESRIDTLENPA